MRGFGVLNSCTILQLLVRGCTVTSGATVRGPGQRTLIHGSSSASVLGLTAERSTTPSAATMASHTRAIVISRQQSALMLISTSAAGTMDPAPLSVRLHHDDVIVIIFAAIEYRKS